MSKLNRMMFAGASLLVLSTPALSQNSEPDSSEDTGEIIVEARRRDESVQDVPAVVNAVTSDTIGKLNLRQFSEIATLVPGLSLGLSSVGVGGNASIRGVNFEVLASGNNGTVEFYLNDASIQSGVVLQSMFDIGQIEVLRGPQGTLRGRASPSGSITVVTRRPVMDEVGAYANITANDIGGYNGNGAINLPLIKGLAALRIAGIFDRNQVDRVHPITGIGSPFSETTGGRISLDVVPSDALTLSGTYQRLVAKYADWDQSESLSEVVAGAPASPRLIRARDRLSIADGANTSVQRYDSFNWKADYRFAGQRLVYVGSHLKLYADNFDPKDDANRFPGREFSQRTVTRSSNWTHEVRLQSEERVAGMFDYVIGGFMLKATPPSDIDTVTYLTAFGNPLPDATPNPAVTRVLRRGTLHEKSIFGNITAHLGEGTEISGGLRYLDFKEDKQLLIPAFNATLQNIERKEHKIIYSASIKHQFSDSFMLYASTGSSFRPPVDIAGNSDLQMTAREAGFLSTAPETSKSYEVGFKSNFLDDKLIFNVTAYHQTFRNYPYRVPNAGVYYINTTANTATNPVSLVQGVNQFNFISGVPVTVNGVEGELNYRPTPAFNIGLVASYSLGKIKNGVIPCNDFNGDGVPDVVTTAPTLAALRAAVGANDIAACAVNIRSGFSAPFSATLQSEYHLPLTDGADGYLRGLFSYNGKSQGDPTNSFDDVDAYGLLNVYLGVRDPDGAWDLSLFAKNVTNTREVLTRTNGPTFTAYREVAQAPTGAQTFNSTYFAITMTPPREFGINLRVALGSR